MIFSHVLYQLSYPAKRYGPPPGLLTGATCPEAGATGLEPATSDVTGRRSNQLNYTPANGCEIIACLRRHANADS
jgi:hypothetical protein